VAATRTFRKTEQDKYMSCVVYTTHNVIPLKPGQEERGTIDLHVFINQLKWLTRLGIQFIPISDLCAWLEGRKSLPGQAAVLTFDDALVSIYEHAFPYLKQQAIPFTIFVIAGLIGSESNFSRHGPEHRLQHLKAGQLRELIESGLVEIGAHSYNHVRLTQIEGEALWRELRTAKDVLEETLNVKVPYLAYPWGNTNAAVVQKAKEAGYRAAFTTQKKKISSRNIDPLLIPRVNWGRRASLFKLYKYYLLPWVRTAG
jgi:peptidoglycan/xylan/chitin deacetylase (PgdA/CDA1 family)